MIMKTSSNICVVCCSFLLVFSSFTAVAAEVKNESGLLKQDEVTTSAEKTEKSVETLFTASSSGKDYELEEEKNSQKEQKETTPFVMESTADEIIGAVTPTPVPLSCNCQAPAGGTEGTVNFNIPTGGYSTSICCCIFNGSPNINYEFYVTKMVKPYDYQWSATYQCIGDGYGGGDISEKHDYACRGRAGNAMRICLDGSSGRTSSFGSLQGIVAQIGPDHGNSRYLQHRAITQ